MSDDVHDTLPRDRYYIVSSSLLDTGDDIVVDEYFVTVAMTGVAAADEEVPVAG